MSITAMFLAQIKAAGLPAPTLRHPIHQGRAPCLCYAWPDQLAGIVICGGIGAMPDDEADAIAHSAQSAGWQVRTVRTRHLRDGSAIKWLAHALA